MPFNQANFLFSAHAHTNNLEFFEIYRDPGNQLLTCAPFGKNQSEKGTYTGLKEAVVGDSGWAHIICRYQFQVDITTSFLTE